MKNPLVALVALLAIAAFSLVFTSAASAETILIDGTAAGGYVNNGSFESVDGADAPDFWEPLPGSSLPFIVVGNNAHDGSNSFALGANGTDERSLAINTNQNTGYTISLGDFYDLSAWTYGAWQWTASDTLTWSIFYTDDDTLTGVTNTAGVLGGTATTLFTGTISPTPGNNSSNYAEYSNLTGTVNDAGAAGKHLWLAFATSQPDDNKFARIDEVNLSVIPEPATGMLLLGVGGLLAVLRRRH